MPLQDLNAFCRPRIPQSAGAIDRARHTVIPREIELCRRYLPAMSIQRVDALPTARVPYFRRGIKRPGEFSPW